MSCAEALPLPRQLVLGAFCEQFQTTITTDDAILRAAIPRLFELPGFTTLTRSVQEVMIALLARRSFKAPTEIHSSAYSQAFMARAANVSRSTLKRAYAAFEDLGWIHRGTQGYDEHNKRFEGTPISFTATFVEALKLDRSFEAAASEITPRSPRASLSHPTVKNLSSVAQNEPHIKEDSLEQSLKRQSAAPAQGPKPVPAELSCLISKGLSCWTVFWLMRLANQSGKRLSDLVEVMRDAIEKRSGRQLVGFLQMKIHDNVDYSWRLKELRKVAQEQAEVHRGERELDTYVDQLVSVGNIDRPVRITRLSNGYYGELEGGRGGIPHGELIRLVQSGRISPWTKLPQSMSEPDTRQTHSRQPGGRGETVRNAMAQMMSIVGIRSPRRAP